MENGSRGFGLPLTPQNSVDLSEAASHKASSSSPAKNAPLLEISDDESDIDDADAQFLDDPVLKQYKNSFKHIGNDPDNVPIFMLTARDFPSEKLINYEDISNRLADYAQEQLATFDNPNYTIYFVAGMAKGEHLPSVKTCERLRLRWTSKKTLKKFFFIHLGVKNNIYISRIMSSLSDETKSKLIKCTKTKSLEKYGHNSKIPLPIDLANFDKNV